MAYQVVKHEKEGREQIRAIVDTYRSQYDSFISRDYNEAQVRADFIDPLIKCLGWDLNNETNKSQYFRDVLQEEPLAVREHDVIRKKNPDYTLRVSGIRQLFIEAKKPAVDILTSVDAAFQLRRYGWNANLSISILTNFEYLMIYDCRYPPEIDEPADVARLKVFHYSEYVDRFSELFELLSFKTAGTGKLAEEFPIVQRDVRTFDQDFLAKIEEWRIEIAQDIFQHNEGLDQEEINFLVQRLLNRIVFLRICEDRKIETHEILRGIKDYEALKRLFGEADRKYNSGLFDFIEDQLSPRIQVGAGVLIRIFNELYYPFSPYDFSVVDPDILSQIYERWLGSKVELGGQSGLFVSEEPEVSASNGVVPTPRLIVRRIVRDTLEPVLVGKTLAEIKAVKIADICCGSGTFLIGLYDYLVQQYLDKYIEHGQLNNANLHRNTDGALRLTLHAKKEILLSNIHGVDLNPYACEVARFSLLLKLLEEENSASVNEYLHSSGEKVLPALSENIKCGNSLVDFGYFDFNETAVEDHALLHTIRPFNWQDEFPFLKENGGFDAIIGNPPYVRIQNMKKYSQPEIDYFQSSASPFSVSLRDNIDKYFLFIERAVSLLNDRGFLGYIVPNKFFVLKSGKSLRKFISKNASIRCIVHFGVAQIFPGKSTYTTILILSRSFHQTFGFQRIGKISERSLLEAPVTRSFNVTNFTAEPWIFISEPAEMLFSKMRTGNTVPLNEIAEIPVGLQTSADKIFIFEPIGESGETVRFKKGDLEFEIENSITHPCLYDVSFGLFQKPQPNALIIFPYEIVDGKAKVLEPEEFERRFPKCWNYLTIFRNKLEKRSITGSKEPKWYQYGRSQSLTKFQNSEKLIWSVLSLGAGYGYDDQNILFTGGGNGPYYALRIREEESAYSIFYILGILAHPVIEAMVKSRASEFRGAYYSHGKQFIEELPIPEIDFNNPDQKKRHDEIAKITSRIVETMATRERARLPDKRQLFDRLLADQQQNLFARVTELFGIQESELTPVLSGEIFLAPTEEAGNGK